MKKLILLSLLLCAFKYHDKVKIIGGFYEGCQGEIVGEGTNSDEYQISITKCGSHTEAKWEYVESKYLKLIK